MSTGKLIGGAILIAIAIWSFMNAGDPTAKYLGSAILAIIGVVLLMTAFRHK